MTNINVYVPRNYFLLIYNSGCSYVFWCFSRFHFIFLMTHISLRHLEFHDRTRHTGEKFDYRAKVNLFQ